MSTPSGTLEFIAFHQPSLPSGDYILSAKQQVQIDGNQFGWGTDQWTTAPSTVLQFSVAGPRFSLDPNLIQAQFPPPKSIGEYYNVLPHIIFNRATLAWERTLDNSDPSAATQPTPWLALLLFDKIADSGAPTLTTLTVQDLLNTYGQSATPTGQPEFIKILPRDSSAEPSLGELKLEVGQHFQDRLTVIDVPKQLLYQILPSEAELSLLSHVRRGTTVTEPSEVAEYPVIFCNRLPAPGTSAIPPVGTESTVHLVSLEARKPLLDALKTRPIDNNLVRLVSLARWSFSTLQRNKTFTLWVKEAWCPNTSRSDPNDPTQPSTCASGILHTLRMPTNSNLDAERFLSQGYVPIKHKTRQGNHLVSWYRSPLLPGPNSASAPTLPVHTSDQLMRYFSDVDMFDTTYSTAWELGRSLTLRSKKVSLSLFNWKRAHAQQTHQAEIAITHLPFSPDYSIAPDFPDQVSQWFAELLLLKHVPFHYLVPRVEMLPVNTLRFFNVDLSWIECLLDGAFSVGRVSTADLHQDKTARTTGHVPQPSTYSGFLLRSHVVTGWPHLGVEAYIQAIPASEAANYIPTTPPAKRLRMDRLGEDVLLCLFEGDIQAVDIHEHPDSVHFGVDADEADPNDTNKYFKELRKLDGTLSDVKTPLPWKNNSALKRTLDIAALAAAAGAANAAEFGVTMIEGVDKIRFIK